MYKSFFVFILAPALARCGASSYGKHAHKRAFTRVLDNTVIPESFYKVTFSLKDSKDNFTNTVL